MRKIIFAIFLLLAAGWDVRTKQIPLWIFFLGGLCIIPVRFYQIVILQRFSEAGPLLLSMGVGVVLLLLAGFSHGAVGIGDGVFFIVSGLYLSYSENIYLFVGGLLICSIFCLVMGVWGQLHQEMRWQQRVPFLPFLIPAAVLLALYA